MALVICRDRRPRWYLDLPFALGLLAVAFIAGIFVGAAVL